MGNSSLEHASNDHRRRALAIHPESVAPPSEALDGRVFVLPLLHAVHSHAIERRVLNRRRPSVNNTIGGGPNQLVTDRAAAVSTICAVGDRRHVVSRLGCTATERGRLHPGRTGFVRSCSEQTLETDARQIPSVKTPRECLLGVSQMARSQLATAHPALQVNREARIPMSSAEEQLFDVATRRVAGLPRVGTSRLPTAHVLAISAHGP